MAVVIEACTPSHLYEWEDTSKLAVYPACLGHDHDGSQVTLYGVLRITDYPSAESTLTPDNDSAPRMHGSEYREPPRRRNLDEAWDPRQL